MKRILTFAVVALTSAAMAQTTVTWTGGGDTTNYTDGANWGGTAPADDLTTDIGQFTGGTVNLGTSLQVAGLDFITAGSTLTGGGALTVGGSGITGSQDLTIGPSTTIDLNGTDTALNYTGNITVGAGALLSSERNALRLDTSSHANTTITLDGGTVSATGNHIDVSGRNIVLTANGGTLRHSHARNMYGFGGTPGNNISGVGQLTIAGGGASSTAGRMQLDSVNTYSGGTRIIEGGQAWMYNNDSLGTGDITMDSGGTIYAVNNVNLGSKAITLDGSGRINMGNKAVTIGGAVSGTGDLTILNSTTRMIFTSSGNTYSGGTTIDNVREVRVANGDSLGTGDITLKNGGTLKNNNNHPTFNQNIVLGEGGGKFESGWGKTMTFNGVISGTNSLTITPDSGTVYLNGDSTYTGETIIQGNVQGNDGSFGTTADGGAVTFDGGSLVANNHLNFGTRAVTLGAGGGTVRVYNNRALTFDGVVDGTGKLTVDNDGGSVRLTNAGNTYSGGTEIIGMVNVKTGGLGTGDVTLNDVNGSRAQVQNLDSVTTLDNNFIIAANGGRLKAGWNKNLTIGGEVSGSGDLTIEGDSGTVVLANAGNTYSGNIDLAAATSKLSLESLGSGANISGDTAATLTLTGEIALSAVSGFGGTTKLGAGGALTGSGAYAGDLTLGTGSALTLGETLSVAGLVALDGAFGIGNVAGLSSSTADGTYTLIDTTSTDFSTLGLDNFGSANPYDLGGGKSAYFKNGSLQVTVIPEPATLSIVVAAGAGMLFIRRRFMI